MFELLQVQLHRPYQSDAALVDPIVIGESQVLLVVEYSLYGQVTMLLLYYKLEALIPQATALVAEADLTLSVSANNQSTFVTFTKLNCEQTALVYGLAGN